ncbi:PAS domain S-box protein [Methylocaldum sp.]|uniref:PAS domain S-box protein n=1 Tax=Methylocaldum sp. TaxID=1969727 RepID=UPI002D58BDDC|nr:PAS domain S-box protein [Methylocaldum sp.]HYE36384.1 PAS domain S-box protein [Methylocaldum sp.]
MKNVISLNDHRMLELIEPGFVFVGLLRPDGVLVEVNRAAIDSIRARRGSVIGIPIWQTPWWSHNPERQDELREAVIKAAGGETARLISAIQAQNMAVSVDLTIRPFRNEAGEVLWLFAEGRGGYNSIPEEILLRESELRFRQITESINDVFWMMDPERTHLLYVSPAYEKIWGRSRIGLDNNPIGFYEAVHAEDRERVVSALSRQILGSYDEEYRIVRPDGTIRWIREQAFPVRNERQEIYRVTGVASDITASRLVQEELYQLNRDLEERIAERTERMRMMIETSAEAVVTIDQHGFIEEWNASAERIFGWPSHDVIGRRLSEVIIPHRYRGAHERGMQRFVATEQGTILNRTIELSALNRQGDEFPVELSVWPVRCGDGYIFSAFLRDITGRKKATQAAMELAERALRFRSVLYDLARTDKSDFSASLLRILRSAAKTLDVARMVFARFCGNQLSLSCQMIYRADRDDVVPEADLASFTMEQYPQYFSAIISNRPVVANDARSDPATVEFKDNYLVPLGITSMLDVPVWLDGRVVAMVCYEHIGPPRVWDSEEISFALGVANLVALTLEASNRAQAEADLRQAEAGVRKALMREQELNELKSRFVSMTSHEFRTPLTAILSSAELLEAYGERLSTEKKGELIGMIKSSVKNMTHMLEEVLFIGKSDTGHLQFNPCPLDVDQFCQELLKEVRAGVGKEHHFDYTSSGDCSSVNLDPHLLRQILLNLLSNGVKFSPKGSTVSLNWHRENDAIHFAVADRGIGIPSEDRSNLFNTFHRARNVQNVQGTGLGLAIVKKCVDLHGGEIGYESEVGRGTRFVVRIPFEVGGV